MPRNRKAEMQPSGENGDSAATATMETQDNLWPELNDSDEHKAILRAARAYDRAKKERAEVLGTMKEKQDNAELKLINLMHEAKMSKFRHDGLTVEIDPGREKATVKTEIDEASDEGDDE